MAEAVTPWLQDGDLTLYVGDCADVLTRLPAESVHCCVTSPPYWHLRDYGADGQIGRESTPQEYVANLMRVFDQVRRVLRPDGTLWLNLGDTYLGSGKGASGAGDKQLSNHGANIESGKGRTVPGLPAKNLVGVPWRVAFALQEAGWWLRSDIIWAKPNTMPESVRDRPTKAHEYIFMLSKSDRYFYDQIAALEPAEWSRWGDQTNHKHEGSESAASWIKPATKAQLQERGRALNAARGDGGKGGFYDKSYENGVRNSRSVWSIVTESYEGAHFATFPEELPRRCISAGTSEKGCCPECDAPWVRKLDRKFYGDRNPRTDPDPQVHRNLDGQKQWDVYERPKTVEWVPSCSCGIGSTTPCVVLDPFAGSGTTGFVARELGRKSVLIELSPEYAKLIAERTRQLSLLA